MAELGQAANLGDADVIEKGSRCGNFSARGQPISLRGGNREMIGKAAGGSCGIKAHGWKGRQRGVGMLDGSGHFLIGQKRVGQEDLTGIEPCQFGAEAR